MPVQLSQVLVLSVKYQALRDKQTSCAGTLCRLYTADQPLSSRQLNPAASVVLPSWPWPMLNAVPIKQALMTH